MPTDLTGQMFGQYRLIRLVSRGGMATVYQGYQVSIDRSVAVKVMPADFLADPNFLTRFLQEARVLAKLTHPAILPLYEFGEVAGVPYIVMPLMLGGTLAGRVRQGALPLAEVVRILEPIAGALEFAHGQGIVHGDVKPSNILFDQHERPFLSDFGLARPEGSLSEPKGKPGLGTPEYMSPEQCRGETPDHRADLYALGIVLYESLTGHRPFETLDPLELIFLHITETPRSPRELRPELSTAVEKTVLRALEKNPADRFQSAAELARALQNAAYLSRGFWLRPDGATPKPAPEAMPYFPNAPTTEHEATVPLPGGQDEKHDIDEAAQTRPTDPPDEQD